MAAIIGPGIDTTAPRLRLLVSAADPILQYRLLVLLIFPTEGRLAAMSHATLDLACRRVFESPLLDLQLEVAWHGGEPLTIPLTWYEEAIALMAERCPVGLQLKQPLSDQWTAP